MRVWRRYKSGYIKSLVSRLFSLKGFGRVIETKLEREILGNSGKLFTRYAACIEQN